MAKFGRYEFGKMEPTEVYEGDYMRQDKSIVPVFRGTPGWESFQHPALASVIRLGAGQSVREINEGTRSRSASRKR